MTGELIPERCTVPVGARVSLNSITCLNTCMAQGKPSICDSFPEQCRMRHPWRPGTVTLTWEPCECEAAQSARGGHIKVSCAAPGCAEVWWSPLHRPIGVLGHHRPGYR